MKNENEPLDKSVMQSAEKLGLIPSGNLDYVFYLTVSDRTNEEIEEIKSKAELAGFFFNGFGTIDEKSAIEFAYNK